MTKLGDASYIISARPALRHVSVEKRGARNAPKDGSENMIPRREPLFRHCVPPFFIPPSRPTFHISHLLLLHCRFTGQGDAQRVGCVDSKSTNGSSNSGSSSRRSSFPPPTSRSSTAAPRSNGHDGAATRSSGRTGGLSGWADVRGPPPSSTAAVGAPSTSPNRRRVSFQGAQGVRLDFNYWVGQATSSQVCRLDCVTNSDYVASALDTVFCEDEWLLIRTTG